MTDARLVLLVVLFIGTIGYIFTAGAADLYEFETDSSQNFEGASSSYTYDLEDYESVENAYYDEDSDSVKVNSSEYDGAASVSYESERGDALDIDISLSDGSAFFQQGFRIEDLVDGSNDVDSAADDFNLVFEDESGELNSIEAESENDAGVISNLNRVREILAETDTENTYFRDVVLAALFAAVAIIIAKIVRGAG